MPKPYGAVSNYGQRNHGKFGGHGHNPGIKKDERYCEVCGQLLKRVRVLNAGANEKEYKYVNIDGRPHICENNPELNKNTNSTNSLDPIVLKPNTGLFSRLVDSIKSIFK